MKRRAPFPRLLRPSTFALALREKGGIISRLGKAMRRLRFPLLLPTAPLSSQTHVCLRVIEFGDPQRCRKDITLNDLQPRFLRGSGASS